MLATSLSYQRVLMIAQPDDRPTSRSRRTTTARERAPGGYTFACTTGVVAKCARTWGYKPWKRLQDGFGELIDIRPMHQACTRAARADYCGDGISHTRDGTMIDMFDAHGFNRRERHPAFVREAGFTPNGARWVARQRWPMQLPGARAGARASRREGYTHPTSAGAWRSRRRPA
jgi:hypothetical protein